MTKTRKNKTTVIQNLPSQWTADIGKDPYGEWLSLNYNDAQQCFRWIKRGQFMTGTLHDNTGRYDKPRQVKLTKGFWMADTTCTQTFWQAITDNNPSKFKDKERPVENVTWHDCQNFIGKLNAMLDNAWFALPTEEQWEYACHSGTTTAYHFGDQITAEHANYGYKNRKTTLVKTYACNAWELYDMHGNVWEWCDSTDSPQVVNSKRPGHEQLQILRGGSWRAMPWSNGSGYRNKIPATKSLDTVGFRLTLVTR